MQVMKDVQTVFCFVSEKNGECISAGPMAHVACGNSVLDTWLAGVSRRRFLPLCIFLTSVEFFKFNVDIFKLTEQILYQPTTLSIKLLYLVFITNVSLFVSV